MFQALADPKTIFLNIRDVIYVGIGILQSLSFLSTEQPDVIFLKGGYVGLPVGIAAAILNIPFVTHDSDAIPSLTNKIVGRWAKKNATGVKTGNYSYPTNKIVYVGVPVDHEYRLVSDDSMNKYREEIGISKDDDLLLVTGGSLGASRINKAVDLIINKLLVAFPKLHIILQAGQGNLDDYKDQENNSRVYLHEFIPNMYKYTGAADLIITRGGANSMSELAAQGKACIMIPNPYLAAGHQLRNAEILNQSHAVDIIYEHELLNNPDVLFENITKLLKYKKDRIELAKNIHSFSEPGAAKQIANILLSEIK